MSTFFPSALTRKKIGPDRPPPLPGSDAPPAPALLPATALTFLNAGRSDVAQNAVPASAQQAQLEARKEGQSLLEGVRIALNALPPELPLSQAGKALFSETQDLSAQTLSVLQPVLEDFRIHAQNALDSGGASMIPIVPVPSAGLLARLGQFLESNASIELRRFATNLQNKISSDVQLNYVRQTAAILLQGQMLGGYGSLVHQLVGYAKYQVQTQKTLWSESGGVTSLNYGGVSVPLRGITAQNIVSYGHAAAQVLATHRVFQQSLDRQRIFNETLLRDLSYLAAIESSLQNPKQATLGSLVTKLTAFGLKQAASRYKSLLKRHHRPLPTDSLNTTALVPLPLFTESFVLKADPEDYPLEPPFPGLDPEIFDGHPHFL